MSSKKQVIDNVDGIQLLKSIINTSNYVTIAYKTVDGVDFVNRICRICSRCGEDMTVFDLKDTIYRVSDINSNRAQFIFPTFEGAKAFREKQEADLHKIRLKYWKDDVDYLYDNTECLVDNIRQLDAWLEEKNGSATLDELYDAFHEDDNIQDVLKLKLQLGQIAIQHDKLVVRR